MSIEKVKEYFKQFNIQDKILEFDSSSATVELAAKALNTEEGRIAKTLSFKIEDKAILIVTSGDVKIDSSKYKKYFKSKAKMLHGDEVLNMIGHNIGGVCPFAINDYVKVYLDISMKRYETIFPACGSSNSAIELTNSELEKYSSNFVSWVDVSKPYD